MNVKGPHSLYREPSCQLVNDVTWTWFFYISYAKQTEKQTLENTRVCHFCPSTLQNFIQVFQVFFIIIILIFF